MSDWREVMQLGEKAKALLVRDQSRGEKAFEDLLREHKLDGMLYFKRGEGWELLGQFQLALSDFRRARGLFRMARWQRVASDAIDRVAKEISSEAPSVTEKLPPMSELPGIDPVLYQFCQRAIETSEKNARVSLVECRAALERIIDYLNSTRSGKSDENSSLAEKITNLRTLKILEPATTTLMHTIRLLGNEAAHAGPVSAEDALVGKTLIFSILKKIFH